MTNFARVEKSLPKVQPWVEAIRRAGIERFDAVGYPDARDEEWRHTNISTIVKTQWELADEAAADAARAATETYSFGKQAVAEIVIVNGRLCLELSKIGKLPAGVKVGGLADAIATSGNLVEKHLARHAKIDRNPFVALNTGFLSDGAFAYFPKGSVVKAPVHVIYVSVPGAGPTVSHPRGLFIIEENAECTIVESYVGASAGQYFTNAVTEIYAGDGAQVDYARLQQETLEAYHVSTMQVELGRATNFVSHAATLGGKLTRNDLNGILNGEGGYATLNGLVIIEGDQHVDNHTLLHHEKANCPSHELYKHVLGGRATGVFKGKIFVQKDAQKTDSKQNSKTLLLSDDAYMNSQPALEIYADDVKCTHGSTTGPVDQDMLFYLRTRGVGYDAAQHLLTYAFAADVTRRIKVEPVRRRLEDYMAAQHGLPQDLRITDLSAHDEDVL